MENLLISAGFCSFSSILKPRRRENQSEAETQIQAPKPRNEIQRIILFGCAFKWNETQKKRRKWGTKVGHQRVRLRHVHFGFTWVARGSCFVHRRPPQSHPIPLITALYLCFFLFLLRKFKWIKLLKATFLNPEDNVKIFIFYNLFLKKY